MSGSGPFASCRKACCSSYTVSITGHDAWFIGKQLHLPLESFLVYFPVAQDNDRGFILQPGGPRHEIALDKVGRYQRGNPCVFWIDFGNGGGRCGIYPYRPLVCQTYPAYQQDDTVALRDDVLCPEGAWNLAGMDLPIFASRLARFRVEQDVHACFVGGWNEAVERSGCTYAIRDFFIALMNVYEGIDAWRAALAPDTVAQLVRRWAERPAGAPSPLVADLSAADDEPWRSSITELRERLRRGVPL